MAMAEHERIIMSKYTEEFRRNAIELMKKVGITKACKYLIALYTAGATN